MIHQNILYNQILSKPRQQFRKKRPILHMDFHSGCGWNHDVDVEGSPIIALDCFRESGLKYECFFIDKNQQCIDELGSRREIMCDPCAHVHCCTNQKMCEWVSRIADKKNTGGRYTLGTIYLDPNGPVGKVAHGDPASIPWEGLHHVTSEFPCIDVIFNFPAGAIKRLDPSHNGRVDINDLPEMLRKDYWMINEPNGMWQWVLCVGRNGDFRAWENANWHLWNSDKGIEIRETARKTRAEIAKQNDRQRYFDMDKIEL